RARRHREIEEEDCQRRREVGKQVDSTTLTRIGITLRTLDRDNVLRGSLGCLLSDGRCLDEQRGISTHRRVDSDIGVREAIDKLLHNTSDNISRDRRSGVAKEPQSDLSIPKIWVSWVQRLRKIRRDQDRGDSVTDSHTISGSGFVGQYLGPDQTF